MHELEKHNRAELCNHRKVLLAVRQPTRHASVLVFDLDDHPRFDRCFVAKRLSRSECRVWTTDHWTIVGPGEGHVAITSSQHPAVAHCAADHQQHGQLIGPAFGELDVVIPGTLIGPQGEATTAQTFDLITEYGTRVHQLFSIEWVSPGHIAWRPQQLPYPCPSNSLAAQVELLIVSLCANFPQLLTLPLLPAQLMAAPDGEHCVEIRHHEQAWWAEQTSLSTEAVERRRLTHAGSIKAAVRAWFNDANSICMHSAISTTLQLYSGHIPSHITFKIAKAAALPTPDPSPERCTAAPAVRLALEQLSWQQLHRDPHAAAAELQVFHRLKAGQWPRWDHATKHTRCQCNAPLADPYHQAWLCPKAQTAWSILKRTWSLIASSMTDEEWVTAIFSLRLPPSVVHTLLGSPPPRVRSRSSRPPAGSYLQALRRADVHVILTHIWRRHWGDVDQRSRTAIAAQAYLISELSNRRDQHFLFDMQPRLLAWILRRLPPISHSCAALLEMRQVPSFAAVSSVQSNGPLQARPKRPPATSSVRGRPHKRRDTGPDIRDHFAPATS